VSGSPETWYSYRRAATFLVLAVFIATCGGGTPTAPQPSGPPTPPPPSTPPANVAPTIQTITVQGRRNRQPPRFADLKETVDVSATVVDPETSPDDMTYQWTATAGTFSGSGRTATWTAPDSATTPAKVTITLKVVENYGHPGQPKNFSHEVTSTVDVALHDSTTEVRRMSEQFLLDFSDTNIKDWQYIMRNFSSSECPNPADVDAERADVISHYTQFDMIQHRVGEGRVTVNFGSFCGFRGRRGDACSVVPVFWESRTKSGARALAEGLDHLAAAYSAKDSRWYLCSSDFEPFTELAPSHRFYAR
jgi:hypothetical protein